AKCGRRDVPRDAGRRDVRAAGDLGGACTAVGSPWTPIAGGSKAGSVRTVRAASWDAKSIDSSTWRSHLILASNHSMAERLAVRCRAGAIERLLSSEIRTNQNQNGACARASAL